MRILFDGRVLSPEALHGIARHGLGLLRELFKDPGGHSYVVLAGSEEAAGWLEAFPKDGDRFRVELLPVRPYRIQEQYLLPRLLRRVRPDLYYSPTFMPPALTRSRVSFTIHDLTQIDLPRDHPLRRRLIWRYLIGPTARRSLALLTVSDWAAERIARWLGVGRDRIKVIGNGLEENYRPRSNEEVREAAGKLDIRGPYFVMMGNSMPHKNLAFGAAAFQRLCGQGFSGELVVVGAKGMDLPEEPGRIIRAEGIGDDLLASLHTGALGMVFPSLAEGFGLPPLEAMACGCPVVATDLEVYAEVLGTQGAYLVPPSTDDTGPMAEKMAYLAGRPKEASARAGANREIAAGYTWSKAGARLREVFDRIEAAPDQSR